MASPMFSPVQRQESFKASRKIAKTPSSKTLNLTVKWPHPKVYKASPARLADAGFYWNPNADAKDNVTCFLCNEDFSEWESHHDPHVIHYDRCGESCPWAIARCGIFAVDSDANFNFKMGSDPDRLPCSKFLENQRYTIFLHGAWPHDKTKGHAATSRRMAGAGFLFTPHEPNDDTAKCPYCGIELSGWDPEDDPVEEHRRRIAKRGTECSFFTARITELPDKKKTVRKTASKAALQTPKPTRARTAKAPGPEADSDGQEESLGRSTRSRTAKTTRTPARPPSRSAAASRSKTTSSIAKTDEPSGSDVVEIAKPKTRGSKRKAKDETSAVEEEGESEAAINPPPKSTRAKKTRGTFEDIEVDVNFEESKPRQTQPRRSARSRSRAPADGTDSDVSVKSTRSTRSTRSTKSTKGATTKSKKAKAQPVVEEVDEGETTTPVQTLKKSTRSMAPPKSARGQKPLREESLESESSGLLPSPPPKPQKPARKSRKKVVESESDDWQSAQEDVAPTPRPSTTKKARGRPPKVAKTPKAPLEPSHVPPSPTPTSTTSHVPGSYMLESELHTPTRDDPSKVKKSASKVAAQPFHEQPSNRNRTLTESRTQPLTSSRLLSLGSKENADDRDTIIIDVSDDEDDVGQSITPQNTVPSSNPLKVNSGLTNVAPKPKTTLAQKRDSFIGVVVEPSPRIKRLSEKARGKIPEKSGTDMDVDEVAAVDQPSRSAATDHDSPAVDKSKAKAGTSATRPRPPTGTSKQKQKQKTVHQSETSDSAMDVDDGDNHEAQDVQSVRDSRQPSTPRRDPPRRLFADDLNPFTTGPSRVDPTDVPNPLLAFEAPYGEVPTEVIHALGEEEKEMTVEEWTKRELEIQLELFQEHGLRKIREFKERAAEVRRQIEAL